ncbi:MAG: hypothetical protein V2A73_00915, partial [Pseudomonadota bacterium]
PVGRRRLAASDLALKLPAATCRLAGRHHPSDGLAIRAGHHRFVHGGHHCQYRPAVRAYS